jgi:hypothetical protein
MHTPSQTNFPLHYSRTQVRRECIYLTRYANRALASNSQTHTWHTSAHKHPTQTHTKAFPPKIQTCSLLTACIPPPSPPPLKNQNTFAQARALAPEQSPSPLTSTCHPPSYVNTPLYLRKQTHLPFPLHMRTKAKCRLTHIFPYTYAKTCTALRLTHTPLTYTHADTPCPQSPTFSLPLSPFLTLLHFPPLHFPPSSLSFICPPPLPPISHP